MSRRLAREKAMQCLFSIFVGNNPLEEAIDILEDEILAEQDIKFAETLVRGVMQHLNELDAIYNPFLKDWQNDRLANVDRTLLRIAVYEMHHSDGIPPTVSINEAVELAKVFGSDESSKFVNAVLDNVRKQLVKETEDSDELLGD